LRGKTDTCSQNLNHTEEALLDPAEGIDSLRTVAIHSPELIQHCNYSLILHQKQRRDDTTKENAGHLERFLDADAFPTFV
jgi:hypothetical protein